MRFILRTGCCLVGLLVICASALCDMAVHFLDVGQADAAVILCDGEALMIDGGNAADSQFIYAYLKNNLGLQHMEYMICTHPHEDHVGGLPAALNACTVGVILSPVTAYDSRPFQSLLKYAERQGVGLTVPQRGDTFQVGGATVTVVSCGDELYSINDRSVIVRIEYGDVAFLFTGDAESSA